MSVTWQKLVFIGLFQLNALLATGQDPLANSIAMGTGNVAEMKRQAEAGKPEAQVKLGDLLSFNQRKTDALEWYRKAAYNGSTEATYRVGEMLLFGAVGNSKAQSIQPSPAEGVLWTFQAATNFHPGACLNMSKAYQQGIGVGINAVEAYAWLQVVRGHSDRIAGRCPCVSKSDGFEYGYAQHRSGGRSGCQVQSRKLGAASHGGSWGYRF
jgi:hypothetical protein